MRLTVANLRVFFWVPMMATVVEGIAKISNLEDEVMSIWNFLMCQGLLLLSVAPANSKSNLGVALAAARVSV